MSVRLLQNPPSNKEGRTVYRVNCVHCEEDVLSADQIDAIDYDAMSDHLGCCQRMRITVEPYIALGELITNFRLRQLALVVE